MVNDETVLYQCAKLHNFPASGSMGCHRLERKKQKKNNNKNTNGYNRNSSRVETLWERLQRDRALNHMCNQSNERARRHRQFREEKRKDSPHYELLPLRTLRSRKALFEEGAFTSVPRGSGPASAEAGRRLHSWGSQLDLFGSLLRGTGSTLRLSSSEEVDIESVEEAPQSVQYEELLEVVTRAVEKLKIDWPAESQSELQKSKLDERFLPSRPPSARRSLPFFPDLHTEVSRSWSSPFSARLFIPASYNYGNIAGLDERGYRAMPRVEQTLASYLSPGSASSLKAPALPSKPLRVTSALVGKGYTAAGQAGACLHTVSVLQAYQADLLKELDEGEEINETDIVELRRRRERVVQRSKTTEGSPIGGEAGCTASFGVRLPPVPSGGRLANPASASGRSDLQRASASVSSARKRSGAGELATPEGVSGAASSGASCRETVTGHHSSGSSNTRGQSRETGSLSRLFGSVETTAQCVCLGPAHCRKRFIQFGAPPPPFNGVSPTLVDPEEGLVMEQEVATLLRKEAIEVVPPHDRESGFYSRYFIVPKKDGGLRLILDLRVLNRSVMKLKFKMLTVKQVVSQMRSEDWFVTIDLKDAYFHVSILPQHRKFLRFAFRGEAYQYRVLPFGLALSPRTFTKCVDAALALLRLRGIRILNYIDDWLILAQSEQVAAQHRDVVLAHMKELGLRLNAKKSVLSPSQRTTYLGMVWDSTTMRARLSPARIESILAAVKRVKEGRSLTVKQFQQLLGLMAAASNVIPFGLLYMRPLQWWLKTRGFSLRGNPLRMIKVTRQCLRALDMWRKPWFLSQGPVLGAPCRRVTLATDASLTGWGAVMSDHTARGLWSSHHLMWHINCLEMLAVFRALKHFLPDLRDRHVLVRTDNTAVVSYINHQGGLRSRPLYKLAHQILVWSQGKLLSLRAVYLPGYLSLGADILSRQGPRPGEWMLPPEVVKQIWRMLGQAQVDLFAMRENTQCPLWYSLVHPAPLGLDAMVHTWPRLRLYAFPPIALLLGVLERMRRDGVSLLLVAPFWPGRLSMDSRQEGSPLTGGGHHLPPPPGAVETLGVASEGAHLLASGLSTKVVETILQSRAPSTRKLAGVPAGWLSAGLTHSTLKVYVAAIATYHAPLGGLSVGKDPLVTRFLRGALRLRPPVRSRVPSWDLSVVLEALCRPPFEPIEEISDSHLTIKTVLLIAITSLKTVGDLQALSVAPSFLDFAPGLAKAFLHPRPGYIPKVPSSAPRPVVLQAFCPPPFQEPDQQKLNCMCPDLALDTYVHRAAMWRKSDQLFVCYGPAKRGLPATKQTLSRWIVDAISCAYESSGLPPPLGVKAHSTRSVSASKAFLEGVSMQDICNTAGWSTPLTFVRFYDLDLRVAPGSSVLRPSSL
ncbi:Transposon Ty3-G Gag-Pol polyprotein [Labeo rohita]|uniref:ribonuclease H n=1 Tax=Labeo rohita TaxID=84645 RepID=A0ABQ8MNG1_LABRO|nr:Transposon Ty3-G Gag-Pol polyprotein [Labeo rohita]